jgi:hypothetical protein
VESYATTVTGTNVDGTPLQVDISASLDLQSGVITWTFRSIDPATGQIPTDPVAGFLPIDDAMGRGEGSVSYTVRPRASDPSGAVVSAQASVVFDTNAPLATNTVSNTVYAIVMSVDEPMGATAPARIKISSLLANHYADPDRVSKPGTAVIGTTGTGAWQYFNGSGWVNIAAVAPTSALLLPQADALRFLPSGLATGSAQLLFVAWDGSQGRAGQYANASVLGGGTPFSMGTGMLAVTLTTVTQAPVWLASIATLTPVLPGTTSPVGQTVQQAFAGVFSGDNGQAAGIAVTGLTGTNSGTWEYEIAATNTFLPMKNVSASNALLLEGNDLILFVPKNSSSFIGMVSLLVHAWDGSTGSGGHYTDGGTANLSKSTSSGGTTPFSSAILTGKLYFNDAPTQSPPASPNPLFASSIPENTPSKAVSVITLLNDTHAVDADKNALGLALTADTGNGVWQYELPGSVWQNVPASLSDASMLLLPGKAMLRFNPTMNYSGDATLSWLAWDGTQGSAGQLFNLSGEAGALATGGGATAFSSTSATATLTVKASPQRPAWSGSGAALTPVRPTDSNPQGNTVASVFAGYFEDQGKTVGIAIAGISGTGLGQWQYMKPGDTTWTNLPVVLTGKALLLSANDLIRFLPNGKGGLGTATLTAYAWDGSAGSDGGTASVHASAFSATWLMATCLVNDAPTLTA